MMNGPDSFIGPVNLGNPVEFTIKQLAGSGDRGSPEPNRSSSTCRSQATTRSSASPKSRSRAKISRGNLASRSARASPKPSTTSAISTSRDSANRPVTPLINRRALDRLLHASLRPRHLLGRTQMLTWLFRGCALAALTLLCCCVDHLGSLGIVDLPMKKSGSFSASSR